MEIVELNRVVEDIKNYVRDDWDVDVKETDEDIRIILSIPYNVPQTDVGGEGIMAEIEEIIESYVGRDYLIELQDDSSLSQVEYIFEQEE